MIQDQPVPSSWVLELLVLRASLSSPLASHWSHPQMSAMILGPWPVGVFFADEIFRFSQFLKGSRIHKEGLLQVDPFLLFMIFHYNLRGAGVVGKWQTVCSLCMVPCVQSLAPTPSPRNYTQTCYIFAKYLAGNKLTWEFVTLDKWSCDSLTVGHPPVNIVGFGNKQGNGGQYTVSGHKCCEKEEGRI